MKYTKTLLLIGLVLPTFGADFCGYEHPPPGDSWTYVAQDLPGALLSAWGTSHDDVWVVGANTRDGEGPQVHHFDGTSWTRMDVIVTGGDLWWVFGFDQGPVFVGGENGVLLRYEDGEVTKMTTPETGLIFGIWGTSEQDMWAVGRDSGTPAKAFLWRYEGEEWYAVDLPESVANIVVVNKVWGTASDDVWFVGASGTILHWDGTAFEVATTGESHPYFTLSGTADGGVVTAVGGMLEGVMLETTGGSEWGDVTPQNPRPPRVVGVDYMGEQAWAVGDDLAILERVDGGWVRDPGPDTEGIISLGLHAVWIDPMGGVWATGGQISAPPYTQGVLLYRGLDWSPPGLSCGDGTCGDDEDPWRCPPDCAE